MNERGRNIWLAVFGVAFGFLEAAVVVYLRELYYPDGFRFPIVIIENRLAVVELVREAATVLMLLGVAIAVGRDAMERFFVFAFLFGVWDIVYYVGLWLFLGWPPSLMTWDVLFLIPVPWLGPVIYPVIVSLFLIAGFLVHQRIRARGGAVHLSGVEWLVSVLGGLVVIVAFCWNWRAVTAGTVPQRFPVLLFAAGLAAGVIPFLRAGRRSSLPRST
ncbi:MAG: hypothetical protein PVJ49_11060 [Acidobacteriota bacterium]|jgi:hypothetical protein